MASPKVVIALDSFKEPESFLDSGFFCALVFVLIGMNLTTLLSLFHTIE
jgi:hypothetical protein